jgi:hypothetical protein
VAYEDVGRLRRSERLAERLETRTAETQKKSAHAPPPSAPPMKRPALAFV